MRVRSVFLVRSFDPPLEAVEPPAPVASAAPLLAVLFFLPALNLAGIPPFSGFLGKLGLLQAGVADGGPLAWLLVAVGFAVTGLVIAAWRRSEAAAALPS